MNLKMPVLIATGLQQQPYDVDKYYYRLKDHKQFLMLLGFDKIKVYPRMTRDFLVEADTKDEITKLQNILSKLKLNGIRIFGTLDNKGNSLFITLTYPQEIHRNDRIQLGSLDLALSDHFVFVALKNGKHDQHGTVFSTSGDSSFYELSGSHVANLYNYMLQSLTKQTA